MSRPVLLPHHAQLIQDSAISPEVAAERGYFSATRGPELEALGFGRAQRRVPGLVIPIHDAHGRVALYQFRPDRPREIRGKLVKYETAKGARMVLDVPPAVRAHLGDPAVPLFITEGARKADSAASRGLACIALLGVWSWLGTNAAGGKMVLPDWREIALNGRVVFLCFDSDVVGKPEVANALRQLADMLESRDAKVRICRLAPGPQGEKTGLDDFFAGGGTVEQLLDTARPVSVALREIDSDFERTRYRMENGRTVWLKPTREGRPVEVILANFEARIAREVVVDDGAETETFLEICGVLEGGTQLPTVQVKAERLSGMSWVLGSWGTRAVVSPGPALRDHLRAAIQRCSTEVVREVRYAHTGWRVIDGRNVYLHGAGGIDQSSHVADIGVELPADLRDYALPTPPQGEALKKAIRASLALLEVAPDRISVPLLGCAYRAPLQGADFSLHLAGQTGVFKTELGTLALRHYGASFESRRPPASWASTPNAIERIAHATADALLLVDDFASSGTSYDVARLHREADRLLRAQGNRAGRARMRADGSLRPTLYPRGLILSTGEDVPRGQSLRARMLVVEIERDDVDPERLTAAQEASALYSAAFAGFVRWLAPRLEEQQRRLRETALSWRQRSAAHRRTPEMLGQVAGAFAVMLDYALESEAIDGGEAETIRQRVEAALLELAAEQVEQLRHADPARRFLELLCGALASGEAHVTHAGEPESPPDDPDRWGWRATPPPGASSALSRTWAAQGKRVGWVRDQDLFLEPEVAYSVAQRFADSQGEAIGVTSRTLWRRLDGAGLLATKDEGRRTVRRRIVGDTQRRVLHLRVDALFPPPPGPAGPKGPGPTETGSSAAPGPHDGPSPAGRRRGSGSGSVTDDRKARGSRPAAPPGPPRPEGPVEDRAGRPRGGR